MVQGQRAQVEGARPHRKPRDRLSPLAPRRRRPPALAGRDRARPMKTSHLVWSRLVAWVCAIGALVALVVAYDQLPDLLPVTRWSLARSEERRVGKEWRCRCA